MYVQLFEKLATSANLTQSISQAVSMVGANAVNLNTTIFAYSVATDLTFTVQESNDLENWVDKAGSYARSVVGYNLSANFTGIASAYVRVKVTQNGAGTAVLAVGMNTAHL